MTDTLHALAHDDNVVGVNWTFLVDPNVMDAPPPDTAR